MLGLNRNYTPQKWISHFLFSISATPMLLYVHRQVNKSIANAHNTVPPHCSGLSAAACLFTSCCGRGIRTCRTGHELRMSFCPISTKQSIARGEKCLIVVLRIGSHVVPFVQQDNTVYDKERDIISVVSSQQIRFHFCLENFALDQPSVLDSRQYCVFLLQCFVRLHVCFGKAGLFVCIN